MKHQHPYLLLMTCKNITCSSEDHSIELFISPLLDKNILNEIICIPLYSAVYMKPGVRLVHGHQMQFLLTFFKKKVKYMCQ